MIMGLQGFDKGRGFCLNRVKIIICSAAFILAVCAMTGCGHYKNYGYPLPSSAKDSGDNIIIPFPYAEGGFLGSDERWIVEQGSPDKLVLNVIYKDKIVASFPVTAGTNDSSGSIRLSGKEYDIVSVTLNSDQVSGFVKLKMAGSRLPV
jgi:hypothetical protein